MRQQGFNLVELLIVLTIIGILTSIGMPIYSQHIIHAHRLEAANRLTQLAIAMEHYYIEHQTYQPGPLNEFDAANHSSLPYRFTLSKSSDVSYELTATLIEGQMHDPCGTLTLNALGEKSASGQTQLSDSCW